ncbi:MAG TPA: hypothetical protein V6C89_13465 [Drouetiella sp.]|jgi:hypothetical protein
MSKLNPEVEAQKTVQSFREAAEKHTSIENVWGEMAKDSKQFGRGSAQDRAYFHAVTEGLKKEGLLPELTVAYAQWHKADMPNDNGDVGKNHIDGWAKMRKLENGRVCEVEQAFIDTLKTSYDSMKKTAERKTGDYDHNGLSDRDLNVVNAEFSKARHANESRIAHEAQVNADAQQLKHGLLDPRKDDGTVLFDKLAKANGGAFISSSSIEDALSYDVKNRDMQHHAGDKNWHSYLNYQDHVAIEKLQQYFNDISPLTGGGRSGARHADKVGRDDLDRYLAAHVGK